MERANNRLKDQHARTIPITPNLVALIFVSLSALTQDQRQVLTSLMAHRNRVLADYNTADLREVYLEIFCTTKTTVDNPLLAPSGHGGRKTFLFLVIEEGYLDGSEGYWVEDEDDGAEGTVNGKISIGMTGWNVQLAEAVPSGTTAATTFFSEYINPLNFSLMATEDKTEEAFISQPLTPTAMVLDLGCTRAMASRVAAQDLMKFCDDNPNCGIWYTIAETTSQFTFANSESTKCQQKLVIYMYDREYTVQSTEFDIVEQGYVPILMSLPQMRNLRFQFELHPEQALISSPVLGIWDVKL
eukprot:s8927_g1.t1